MEVALFLVPTLLALFSAWSGFVRVASRSFGWLTAGLAVFGGAALLCWMIGEGKTGGYLAGIVGVLMTMLMGAGAAGMVAGGVLRWGCELFRRHVTKRPLTQQARPETPGDIIAIAVLGGVAVAISAME